MDKEQIVPEAGENASTVDNNSASPAEEQKTQEAEKITEDIDPRIVEIVGKDNIQSAFSEEKKEEEKTPADEKKEEEKEPPKKEESQENKAQEDEQEVEKQPAQQLKPSRLDRRLASRYIHNLHLSGETNIPTEEEILAKLAETSKEEKIEALQFHLKKTKELTGDRTRAELDDEDREAILDAEREEMRRQIMLEEQEVQTKREFVSFLDSHPELLEGQKEYSPKLAKAVETLWRGGMPIQEAFETVTGEIEAVKQAHEEEVKRAKDTALAGVLSGTGQVPPETKSLTWDDVAKIEQEDPQLYRRMLAEGKFKHLE